MSDRISFRLPPEAQKNLENFMAATGKKASEIARAGLEIYMAQCGWRLTPFVGQVSDNPHVRAQSIDLDLSKDKSSCRTNERDEIQDWFKKFWVVCENKQMPKRVIGTIKDNWGDLSELVPSQVAEAYNSYCQNEASKGREYCHPNSWLAGGGYESEEEEREIGGIAYDIE